MSLEVPEKYWRGPRKTEEIAVRSAVGMLEHIAAVLGRSDLAEVSMLDVGCGVKFSQAILNEGVAIGRYVGIDVSPRIIEFLASAVTDHRMAYQHFDARNERYNPDGRPMDEVAELPVGGEQFDVICLFSVFTHLDPHDYVAMLRLLRPHIKPTGRLLYSLFIDEKTPGGHGLSDRLAAQFGDNVVGKTEGFRDLDPEKPLFKALYSRQHAIDLVAGTGWTIETIGDPIPFVQHLMVCAPS